MREPEMDELTKGEYDLMMELDRLESLKEEMEEKESKASGKKRE